MPYLLSSTQDAIKMARSIVKAVEDSADKVSKVSFYINLLGRFLKAKKQNDALK